MKKYFAPIARNINIEMEAIIAMSTQDTVGYGEASNRRQSASEAIWGLNDETSINE